MLIRGAEIASGRSADVRLAAGRIVEVARRLPRLAGEAVLDAAGCSLLPGLHDHHLHLLALAAALGSVECGPPSIGSSAVLAKELRSACIQNPGGVRGVGYHESLGVDIDRYWLDRVSAAVPIRIQHRSGRLWILNTAALKRLGEDISDWPAGAERGQDGIPTGRFYHLDAWLRTRMPSTPPPLEPVSRLLASYGVTGVTDAGPDNDAAVLELLRQAQQRGELVQRVLLMGTATLPAFRRDRFCTGAHKIYLKESALPVFDQLCADIAATHSGGRPVAFHCVTRTELQVALSALAEVGTLPGDRIEHASIADDAAIAQLAERGLTVVTQPNFVFERGDRYLHDVDPSDLAALYRGQSFLAAHVQLAAGTDAPYGHPDPWLAIRSAMARRTRAGRALGGREALTPEQAIALFTGDSRAPGRPRELRVGAQADLCLLRGARRDVLAEPASERVRATICAGNVIYESTDWSI